MLPSESRRAALAARGYAVCVRPPQVQTQHSAPQKSSSWRLWRRAPSQGAPVDNTDSTDEERRCLSLGERANMHLLVHGSQTSSVSRSKQPAFWQPSLNAGAWLSQLVRPTFAALHPKLRSLQMLRWPKAGGGGGWTSAWSGLLCDRASSLLHQTRECCTYLACCLPCMSQRSASCEAA